jgi:hypothetical protein
VWAQNFGGGLGAAALTVGAWLGIHGLLHTSGLVADVWPRWSAVGVGALAVGLLVFGWAMVVTALHDELQKAVTIGQWNELVNQNELLRSQLQEQADALRLKDQTITNLEAELRIALNKLQVGSKVDKVFTAPTSPDLKAHQDAVTLLERALAGDKWGRDHMNQVHGWGQTRWDNAQAKLVAARLVTYEGRKPKLATKNRTDAYRALEQLKLRESQARAVSNST